jgi:hypothetical protein
MVHKHARRKKQKVSKQSKQERKLADIRISIEEEMESVGTYTHNIVSLLLRRAAHLLGRQKANILVEEFNLTKRLGIPKED